MRRFFPPILLCLLFAGCILPSRTAVAQISINPNQPAERLYLSGANTLASGKRFDRAIEYFTLAVRKEPKNSRYTSALGMAYTARAYSLSRALALSLGYTARFKKYEKFIKEWRAAQGDKTNFLSGLPEPPAPFKEIILDDSHPFVDDEKTTQEKLKMLSQSAMRFLHEGVLLADATPGAQAESLHAKAWGLLLLWKEVSYTTPDAVPPKIVTELTEAAEKASEVVPDSLFYKRALGDILVLAAYDNYDYRMPERARKPDQELLERGLDTLKAVLKQTPKDIS